LHPIFPPPTTNSRIDRLIRDLQDGRGVADSSFDRMLAPAWRKVSEIHWTPVKVCIQVARLLGPRPTERVLDIGSGVGKFCVAASLARLGVFVGVERRAHLVQQARRLARAFGARRAEFIHGDAFELDWSAYSCLYLYNPFAELQLEEERRIDVSARSSPTAYSDLIAATVERLEQMPAGTRVATYHGFGGRFPASYVCRSSEQMGAGDLELWVKQDASEPDRPAA
jgi:SAM-dependent methyltransferase